MTRFIVALYALDLAWGGPEEGGWWYEAGTLVRPLRVCATEAKAIALSDRANCLLETLQRARRPVSSAAYADGRHAARVFEHTAPDHYPTERPTYA